MKRTITPLQKMLNVWAIILIVWSIYRWKLLLPEWFDEIIAKPLVFILPVFIYIKCIEKKQFFQQIWLNNKDMLINFGISISVGLFFFTTLSLANYYRDGSFSFLSGITMNRILLLLPLTLFTGISEEILSRGFVVKRIWEDSNNILSAAFLGSILFLILHIPIIMTNLKLTGSFILIFMATEFFLSFINSIVYLERKSLVPVIFIHAFYNLAILLFI